MPYKDPEKQKLYLHEYQKVYHQNRYSKCIQGMLEYLGGECVQCGSKENLEFDHIDPKTKSFSITRKWNRRWEVLKLELDKCQLLCKDCHLTKTSTERKVRSGSNPD